MRLSCSGRYRPYEAWFGSVETFLYPESPLPGVELVVPRESCLAQNGLLAKERSLLVDDVKVARSSTPMLPRPHRLGVHCLF